MDFQYCDRCGDITQANHAQGDELLCASCAGKGSTQKGKAAPEGLDLLQDPTQEIGSGTPLGTGDLDFFSNDTLAMRREVPKPKSTSKLKLVDERPGSTANKKPGSAVLGVTQPLRSEPRVDDERWRVDCLHCAGSLSVRPASKRSKLRCPRCKGVMVLEPNGQVSSVGSSSAQRKDAAQTSNTMAPPPPAAPPVETPPMPRATPTSDPIPDAPPAMAASATDSDFGATSGSSPFGGSAESLAVYKDTFIGPDAAAETGGSTTTAVAPPLDEPYTPATAPIAGGGTEFAISPDSLGSALGDEGAYSGAGVPSMTRHATATATETTTVGSFTGFAWITVALVPCMVGLLTVHQSSGAFGEAILTELGRSAAANADTILNWCANLLGK